MFNEILTGKATLEAQPPQASPYREQATLPSIKHACMRCQQTYSAPAGSTAGNCPACCMTVAALSTDAVHRAMAEQARRDRSHKLFRGALFVVIAIGVAAFRWGMRTQMREDAAVGAGYHSYAEYQAEQSAVYPTDELSQTVHDFANELCRCSDLACSRNVQAQLRLYVRNHGTTDDRARASVDADTERLYACAAKLENP